MKKILKIFVLFVCLSLLFKGWIYRCTVTYREDGQRRIIVFQDSKMLADIRKRQNHRVLSLEEIVEISRSMTNARLRFTTGVASSNPNTVIRSGKANCVGYSALFCSIVNQLSSDQQGNQRLRARHLVGKLYFLGVDMIPEQGYSSRPAY